MKGLAEGKKNILCVNCITFPVLLVVRNSAGAVRWMEIRDWLRTATDNGKKTVTQIVFDGERFDVMSIRGWRDRVLAQPPVPDSTD